MIKETKQTPLHQLHIASGAKMAPFSGYDMPIQYKEGIIHEHNWVRDKAGLFDVSHMGQFVLEGKKVEDFLSYITPTKYEDIPLGKSTYTTLTNENGGIIDDLIVTRVGKEKFFLVLNASRKEVDEAHIRCHLPRNLMFIEQEKQALIALQGKMAEEILQPLCDTNLSEIEFMHMTSCEVNNIQAQLFRSGYTGEDGFEISIPAGDAENLWQKLLKNKNCQPIGLGARDSLRLEAGLPLYGNDLDEKTSPIEATLKWTMSPNHNNFIGAENILRKDAQKKRIGIKIIGKGIARQGAKIYSGENEIGNVTSGGFCPSLNMAIAQGYVLPEYAQIGKDVEIEVRNKRILAQLHKLRFLEK